MILIRVIVGLTFVIEGSLKFLRPEELGAGRFEAIGLPFAHPLALLVGGVEIIGGIAILLNFYAGGCRAGAAGGHRYGSGYHQDSHPAGRPLGPFALAKLNHYGWLSFLHEARIDLCMVFGLWPFMIDSGLRVGRRRHCTRAGG